jgi:AcrR family transcriptional regulator
VPRSSTSAPRDSGAAASSVDGRPLGERGARTRRRLLDATATLLDRHGARELRVVDIAREVGTSPAAFYQYFRDVDAALVVIAEEAGEALRPLAARLDESWTGPGGIEHARRFVDDFVNAWDAQSAVLRLRNLHAQEGDQAFRRMRNRANQPFIDALVALVERSQAGGRVSADLSPIAAAAALMSLLERMAAFHTDLEELGVDRRDLVETTARIAHQTVAGA